MNIDELHWQNAEPWDDTRRLWLRDNLSSFDEMATFVFETEEFKQTRRKVDDAIDAASHDYRDYVECAPSFPEWLWNIGGCYIQNFEAQDVLVWAIKEELSRFGFDVDEECYPPRIKRRR